MDCDCCGRQVGEGKKYVIYTHRARPEQFTLCKTCLRNGMMAPDGHILAGSKVIAPPKLAFPFRNDRKEFCKVAQEEGWITQSRPSGVVVVEEHFRQAMMFNYFSPPDGWKKDTSKTPVENFRKSCRNIKEHYPSWVRFAAR